MDILNDLSPLLGWALIIVIMALIIPTYWYIRNRQRGNAWQDVAAQHGLNFVPAEKIINGTYRSQAVTLDVYYPTGPDHKIYPATRITISLAKPVNGYLNARIGYGIAEDQLAAANRMAQQRKMNMNYVHTGDKEIDRKVSISAPSGEFASHLLTDNNTVREAILRKGTSGTIILEGQQLRYEWAGIETKGEKLQSNLDLLTNIAELVD